MLTLFISSCSIFDDTSQMSKNAEQLAAEGNRAFMDEDYRDAVKAYTDLKDWYPFSRYAILAELKIADSHYHLEEYEEAILAYKNFEKMHPRNDAVPYVIYQTGMSWFNQIDTIDRDPSPAKKSMALFRRLQEQYPDSKEAKAAGEKIGKCLENIAGHELYVADFYYKTKQYQAALKRYEYIVEFLPETDQAKSALAKIPECAKAAKAAEAKKIEPEKK